MKKNQKKKHHIKKRVVSAFQVKYGQPKLFNLKQRLGLSLFDPNTLEQPIIKKQTKKHFRRL